ncbi:hypothetical protein BGZ93_000904 [Podila epicladia]|nr:hypothetical protein BGZ93_000904 [Podila epicladia]KAG0085577.1 hypothetical protein BGZ92_008882 [Podila epicladia]
MSNILSPIVARYSLFFSLVIFDSSWVSRAKNPAQAVQEALLLAQQRYQESAAQKLKALIRNASIASSASTSSNKSKHSSSSVLTSNSLSTAPTSTCSTPASSRSSNIVISLTPCDNTSPINVEHLCMSSQPCTHDFVRRQGSDHSDNPQAQPSSSSTSSSSHNPIISIATVAYSSLPSTSLSSSPSPSPLSSIPPSILHQNRSHVPSCNSAQTQGQERTLIQCTASSSVPSPPSSSMTKYRQKRSSSRKNPKASIATLLSVALAMILLSLLHSRRQRLRKRRQSIKRHSRSHSCRSHSYSPSHHHHQRLITGEATNAIMTLHFSRPLSPQPHKSARRSSHDYLGVLPTTASTPNIMDARPRRTRSHRQSKVELVTAWLDQQDTRASGDENHALNDPWLAMSQEEEAFSIISNRPHGSDQYGEHVQYTDSHQLGHGSHKRSVSLLHPSHVSPEEQELKWYRERYQSHHQHGDLYYQKRYSIHHSRPSRHRQQTTKLVEFHHQYSPIGQVHGWEPLGLASQKRRSAYELAWERHLFYQEQQYQEEMKAERKKIEERQQQEQYWQYQQEHYKFQRKMEHQQEEQQNRHHRPLSMQLESCDTVARTGSLNRLRSTSLSKDTARVLGLCRSTTISIGGKKACKINNKSTTSPKPESIRIARTLLSVEDANNSASTRRRVISHDSIGIELSSNHYDTISSASSYFASRINSHSGSSSPALDARPLTPFQLRDHHRPSVSAPSTLSRKKTLKDLAPALRSLARACSTRFSRPNSMDVSSVLAQGERPGRSSTQSDHMNDFRPLSMGPDSLAEFQQQQRRNSLAMSSALSTAAPVPVNGTTVVFLPIAIQNKSPGTTARTKERPAVYRKVTPFRSNTPSSSSSRPRLVSSVSLPQNLESPDESSRLRNSMRFANGRGLDYYFFNTDSTNEDARSEVVAVAVGAGLDDNRVENDIQDDELAVPEEVIQAIGDGDDDENRASSTSAQEAIRREIVALLAKGVRPLSAAATAALTQEAPPAPPAPVPCLSPLAVEAQEELPLPPSPPMTPDQANDMYLLSEADLCDRIAFMLVPRYKYRYQPLVAH